MKSALSLFRVSAAVLCLGGFIAIATVARDERPVGDTMTDAAEKFLDTLSPELRQKAAFDFDDPHRTGWFFTPQQDKEKNFTRKGARFEEMSDGQKKAALALLRTGTSAKGYEQATTIMSLEGILREAEGGKGAMVRNPNWYFVSVFGKPAKTGKWGWRVEGHHLSVSFTIDRGEVQSPTPYFFGANPATVKAGPRAGLRTLPEIEDLARELIASFTEDQNKLANQGDKQFPEVAENTPAAKLGVAIGVAASAMTVKQRETLVKLLEAYTNRMPSSVAAAEMKAVNDAGIENVKFAYTGSTEAGKGYTYRAQGPTFVAQFLNVQADGSGNQNNHIHSVWRRLPADFGLKN